MSPPRWDLSHSPLANPLGCNGRPGKSGYSKHKHAGEEVCPRCRKAYNHWQREHRRKAHNGRRLRPCGTQAAAARHRRRGEKIDFACAVAEANYWAEHRAKKAAERKMLTPQT